MATINKRWRFLEIPAEEQHTLMRDLKIHPVICGILAQRGIHSYEAAKKFFRPSMEDGHDPFLMKSMDKAVSRIITALKNNESILVYGDYDVDGTTSVALVFDFLKKLKPTATLEYYIPNRYREGYGLSTQGVEYAIEKGFSLLITLDCGIKSVELVAEAKAKGIDTIICDHHLPGEELPDAIAILNPKQKDCPYPFKELCGCGVGYKLIQALCHELQLPPSAHLQYLEWVATAIAADIVPINGENRTLAFHGIQKANTDPSTGIKALMELSTINGKINIGNLSYMIGPRINAAGRMDDAKKAVQLFIEKDSQKAKALAILLQTDNSSRREADARITEEAMGMIAGDPTFSTRKSTVVYAPHWHKGVIGIVASRLLEKYYRPTIVLTKSGDYWAGSARSIPGFNIHDALDECRDLLKAFGGHYFAAGMTMMEDNLQAFSLKLDEIASRVLSEEQMIPEIIIDAAVEPKDLTPSFYHILDQMEPFGPVNPKPVFCILNAMNRGSRIVKNEHVRFDIEKDGASIQGIGFNMAEKFLCMNENMPLDLVFTLEENHYNNQTTLQMKVMDFRESVL
jgi:single-stranded-DNA-specific exonuclease